MIDFANIELAYNVKTIIYDQINKIYFSLNNKRKYYLRRI